MIDEITKQRREQLVLDHFHDEVKQNWDDVLSTFPHPRYEIIPLMVVHDGDDEVRNYYSESRTAFPDQDHEIIAFRHSDDAVIVEFWLKGTHLGPLNGIPPAGNKFRVRMTAFFIFDDEEVLVCERIYFDSITLLKQLLGGINFKSPKNWPLLIKAVKGLLASSSSVVPSELTETRAPDFPNYRHRK